jgi:hypothetical protein
MRWYTTILGRDFELRPSLSQVREAARILEDQIYYWLQPPFWQNPDCCLKPDPREDGKGHGDGQPTPDVYTETHGRIPFRLSKGFRMLHRDA